MNTNNLIFTRLFFMASTLFGSVTSVLLHAAFVWAIFRLFRHRIQWVSSRLVIVTGFVVAAYPVSEFVSLIVNERGVSGLKELSGSLVFFCFVPVMARISVSRSDKMFGAAIVGSAIACFGSIVFSFVDLWILRLDRAEAGDGNPGVLAVVGLLVASISLIGALSETNKRSRSVLFIAALCGFVTVALTGMRALLPLIVLLPLMICWMGRSSLNLTFPSTKKLSITLLLLCFSILISSSMLATRADHFWQEWTQISASESWGDGPIARRFRIWSVALEKVQERPLFGYGPDITVLEFMKDQPGLAFDYTHFHNHVLNAMMRSGLLGVLGVLAIFLWLVMLTIHRSKVELDWQARSLIGALAVTYFTSGLTGIMFGHDILNAVFLYVLLLAVHMLNDKRVLAA